MASQLRYGIVGLVAIGLGSSPAVACSSSNQTGADAAGDRPSWGDVVIPAVPKDKIGDVVFDENQVRSY